MCPVQRQRPSRGARLAAQVGTATFDLVGFLAFTASAVLEALRVVLVQVLMGHLRYNAAEARPPPPPPTPPSARAITGLD